MAVLALGAVACDRNELGEMDSMSINPIEAIIVTDFEQRFDNLNNFMRGFKKPNTSPSTSKSTQGVTLQLIWFTHTSDSYVYVRPGGLGEGCDASINPDVSATYVETYTYDGTANTVVIAVDDSSRTFNVPADLQPLYEATFLEDESTIFFADFATDVWSFREGNTPTGLTITD